MATLVSLLLSVFISLSFAENNTFYVSGTGRSHTFITVPNDANYLSVNLKILNDNNDRRRLIKDNVTITCILQDKITRQMIAEVTINTNDTSQCKFDKNIHFIPGNEYIISVISTHNGIATVNIEESLSPTNIPSIEPTFNPTITPTISPTFNPTTEPTGEPTNEPTILPTLNPTLTPTINPTSNPSVSPTFEPTNEPTFEPTNEPTQIPTLNPNPMTTTTPFENTPLTCTQDVFMCPDGSVSYRDGFNNCNFFPCPTTKSPTLPPTLLTIASDISCGDVLTINNNTINRGEIFIPNGHHALRIETEYEPINCEFKDTNETLLFTVTNTTTCLYNETDGFISDTSYIVDITSDINNTSAGFHCISTIGTPITIEPGTTEIVIAVPQDTNGLIIDFTFPQRRRMQTDGLNDDELLCIIVKQNGTILHDFRLSELIDGSFQVNNIMPECDITICVISKANEVITIQTIHGLNNLLPTSSPLPPTINQLYISPTMASNIPTQFYLQTNVPTKHKHNNVIQPNYDWLTQDM